MADGMKIERRMIDESFTYSMGVEPFGNADLIEDRTDYRCSACETTFTDYIAFIYPDHERWPKYCPECERRFKEVKSDG